MSLPSSQREQTGSSLLYCHESVAAVEQEIVRSQTLVSVRYGLFALTVTDVNGLFDRYW
jgi:hypothetical protein